MRSPELEAAYRDALYELDLPEVRCVRRIGVANPAADAALSRAGCRQHWHYLTPFNPASIRLSENSNQARLQDCAARISGHGWRSRPANGHSADGDWQEPGFVIFDVAPHEVADLAREFGQLALVGGVLGDPPELIWL